MDQTPYVVAVSLRSTGGLMDTRTEGILWDHFKMCPTRPDFPIASLDAMTDLELRQIPLIGPKRVSQIRAWIAETKRREAQYAIDRAHTLDLLKGAESTQPPVIRWERVGY